MRHWFQRPSDWHGTRLLVSQLVRIASSDDEGSTKCASYPKATCDRRCAQVVLEQVASHVIECALVHNAAEDQTGFIPLK